MTILLHPCIGALIGDRNRSHIESHDISRCNTSFAVSAIGFGRLESATLTHNVAENQQPCNFEPSHSEHFFDVLTPVVAVTLVIDVELCYSI